MFNSLRELLDIISDYRDRKRQSKVCESCETLKQQLALSNNEKRELLDRILVVPSSEPKVETKDLKPIVVRQHLPWNARRQQLEQEDRDTAQRLAKQRESQTVSTTSIDDLEQELKIVTDTRESASGDK